MQYELATAVHREANRRIGLWAGGWAPLLLVIAAGAAQGAEVLRWVDEQGVTQFSDAQFAPLHADAELVEIAPANGMVPAIAPNSASSGNGLRVVTLKLEGKRNKKGWRDGRTPLYTGRRHQSNRYR